MAEAVIVHNNCISCQVTFNKNDFAGKNLEISVNSERLHPSDRISLSVFDLGLFGCAPPPPITSRIIIHDGYLLLCLFRIYQKKYTVWVTLKPGTLSFRLRFFK